MLRSSSTILRALPETSSQTGNRPVRDDRTKRERYFERCSCGHSANNHFSAIPLTFKGNRFVTDPLTSWSHVAVVSVVHRLSKTSAGCYKSEWIETVNGRLSLLKIHRKSDKREQSTWPLRREMLHFFLSVRSFHIVVRKIFRKLFFFL